MLFYYLSAVDRIYLMRHCVFNTMKHLYLFILLFIGNTALAAPFAPLNDRKAEETLYYALAQRGEIKYSVSFEGDYDISESEKAAYLRMIDNSLKSWGNMWRFIPDSRRGEFSDLKSYLEFDNFRQVSPDNNPDIAFILLSSVEIERRCGQGSIACSPKGYILLPVPFEERTVLHEIGHAFGLADQYRQGLWNARTDLADTSIKENGLMALGADTITCDEADGAIYLLDCVLRVGKPVSRAKGWQSLCSRNVEISDCKTKKTEKFFEGGRDKILLPIYDKDGRKNETIKASKRPIGDVKGFDVYADYKIAPYGFTNNEEGFVEVSSGISDGVKIYAFAGGKEKAGDYFPQKWIDDNESFATVIAVAAANEENLLSYTLQKSDGVSTKIATDYAEDGVISYQEIDASEVYDNERKGGFVKVTRIIFGDRHILLAQADNKGGALSVIYYKYGSYEPFRAEYYNEGEVVAREISKIKGVYKTGTRQPSSSKKVLNVDFLTQTRNKYGSFQLNRYNSKGEAEILSLIDERLLNGSSLAQRGVSLYKKFNGYYPGGCYRSEIAEEIRKSVFEESVTIIGDNLL